MHVLAGKPRRPHLTTPNAKALGPRKAAPEADEEAGMSPLQQAIKKLRQMKLSQTGTPRSGLGTSQVPGSSPLSAKPPQQQAAASQPSRFGPSALNFGSRWAADGDKLLSPAVALHASAASGRHLTQDLSALRMGHQQASKGNQTAANGASHEAHDRPSAAEANAHDHGLSGLPTSTPRGLGATLRAAADREGAASDAAHGTARINMRLRNSEGSPGSQAPSWQLLRETISQPLSLGSGPDFTSPSKVRIAARMSASGLSDSAGLQKSQQPGSAGAAMHHEAVAEGGRV